MQRGRKIIPSKGLQLLANSWRPLESTTRISWKTASHSDRMQEILVSYGNGGKPKEI